MTNSFFTKILKYQLLWGLLDENPPLKKEKVKNCMPFHTCSTITDMPKTWQCLHSLRYSLKPIQSTSISFRHSSVLPSSSSTFTTTPCQSTHSTQQYLYQASQQTQIAHYKPSTGLILGTPTCPSPRIHPGTWPNRYGRRLANSSSSPRVKSRRCYGSRSQATWKITNNPMNNSQSLIRRSTPAASAGSSNNHSSWLTEQPVS